MIETTINLLRPRKHTLQVVKQDQVSECGHACVVMIINYYGHSIDLYSLRALHEPSINGSNLADLMHILEELQFQSRAIRVDISDLHQVQCPAILHWNMNHFIVLKSVGSHHAIVHDPAVGKRKISFDELSRSFTGIVLEVEKSVDFSPIKASNTLSLLDIFQCVKGLKNSLFVLFLLSLIVETFVLVHPIFLQYITDHVASTHSLNNLYVIAMGFILLTFSHVLIDYMRSHFVVYLTNKISEYFASGVMRHLLKLPFDYFERRPKGDILSKFHAMGEIQKKITTDSIHTILDAMVILFVLIIMAIYSWQLTWIVIFSLVVYVLWRFVTYRHLKNQTEISVNEHAKANSKFLEIIQGIMSIKLFSKESTLYRDWNHHFINSMNADIRIAKMNILYNIAAVFFFNIEHILVLVIGAVLVINNKFSVGMLVAFLVYRQILVNKASSFIQKVFEYKLVSIQIARVADILMQKTELEKRVVKIQHEIQGDIKVQNVNYRYSESHPFILRGISFHIHKAEKVVITGPSGIGKTTLLKMMLGLINPTDGHILVDDISLDLLDPKQYKSVCATVMQDDKLMSGSVLDNITFMDNPIDIDKVYQVAKMAEIHHEVLNMPMGYETWIGDMGSFLSGGQKQRILLARALYKNPRILFLDEATSHLDVNTERKINEALKQLQITQVLIAHREESIKMADRIIKLEP